MLAAHVSNYLERKGIHYGWVIAAVTFVTMLATAGAVGSAGVLIAPLEREFGWSNAQISSAIAIRFALYGLLGPFAAAFLTEFGVRKVVSFALLMIMSSIVLSYFMTELWQLIALWGVVLGIGTGMTALVLGAMVATRWFTQRRGLVMGFMTASTATGQLVFLPLLAALTESLGWRAALGIVVVALVIALGLMLLFMKDRPEDLGLAPFGESEVRHSQANSRKPSFASLLLLPIQILRDVSRSGAFWALFATFFVCGLSTSGLIQMHWISICGDAGISSVRAAGLLALIGVFDLVGTIGSGYLSDRYDNRWLLFWFYALRGLSLLFLPFSDFTIYTLSIFAIFYGLDWIATVPPTVKLCAEHFGADRAAMVFGWVFCGHQLGSAFAAYSAGVTRVSLETYMPALIAAGLMCFIAALVILTLSRPGEPQARAAVAT